MAAAALQARGPGSFTPASQFLGVRSLDVASETDPKTSPLAQPMIDPRALKLVRATYFPDVPSRSSAYASPLLAPSLVGLPPTGPAPHKLPTSLSPHCVTISGTLRQLPETPGFSRVIGVTGDQSR